MTFEEIVERLGGVDPAGMARCPGHGDRSPSLSVTKGDNKTLIHCHAGCSVNDALAPVGLTVKDLFERRNGDNHHDTDVGIRYRYVDETNTLLFEVVRKPGKKFFQDPRTANAAEEP